MHGIFKVHGEFSENLGGIWKNVWDFSSEKMLCPLFPPVDVGPSDGLNRMSTDELLRQLFQHEWIRQFEMQIEWTYSIKFSD